MEEEEQEQRTMRIFVGGLGKAVTGDDLRRLFESLDTGERLRLEKAKENYLAGLKKEWEEEALVNSNQSPPSDDDDDVSAQNNALEENPNARRASNIPDTKQLRVFFPRLRKVKSIPFSGSGKHKYSFQNIKVPPMPVQYFCDCEEHCSPFVKERGKLPSHGVAEIGGINDKEINIMNVVMNKLFEKEKVSNTKDLGKGQDSIESPDALPLNECEVDSATDDDDDDLIINIETKKNKAALSGSHELERIMENPESWSNKTRTAKEEPNEEYASSAEKE
ncbi:protein REPRESSOR OF SILENCING 3-like [Lotus japonicus]|uniref:protein REPRESSOR OF SILENCING 3-like n=1 Tax=Lotus japonicus TaxID=34305 RepID=UPI00258AE96F|nr:protein REPRESSOR OF SILENCING 3-like [Lotus japonicus]